MSSIAPPPSQGWSSFFSTVQSYPTPDPAKEALTQQGSVEALPKLAPTDAKTFLSWDKASQEMYMRRYKPDGFLELTLREDGKPDVAYRFRLNGDEVQSKLGSQPDTAYTNLRAGTVSAIPSLATLTAGEFRSWRDDQQIAYINAMSNTTVPSIALRTTTADTFEVFLLRDRDANGNGGKVFARTETGLGLQPTPGMRIDFDRDGEVDIPYYHLPGSADGNKPSLISQGAAYLFPALDGYNNSLADTTGNKKPDTFDTWTPDSIGDSQSKAEAFLKDFSTWHSSFQTEWVHKYATAANPVVEMPSVSAAPIVSLFITNQNPRSVVNVATITKEAIARLSDDDQTNLAKSKLFINAKAADLGLTIFALSSATDGTIEVPTSATENTTKLVTSFNEFYNLVKGSDPTPISPTDPKFDNKAFRDQLDLIRTKITGTVVNGTPVGRASVIDTKLISKEILDLRQRYDRAKNYYDAGYGSKSQQPATNESDAITWNHDDRDGKMYPYLNVVSTDNGETIKQGYRTFIAQEQRLAENATNRYQAATGKITGIDGKPFDLPTLIYYLQNLYNTDLEALVTIETESVRQTNAYLKDYADWQDMVNRTLQAWGKDDTSTKGLFGGSAGDGNLLLRDGGRDNKEVKLALMFDARRAGVPHPVEMTITEQSPKVTRPAGFYVFQKDDDPVKNYDYNTFTRDVWQTYGTRLGEKVTQLNQDSQQKMNDINNMDKQRNRHYDLANSALSKMNDALQAILRATG